MDEFLKELEIVVKQVSINQNEVYKKPTRTPKMSGSEIASIILFYHFSQMKCFEYYCKKVILKDLKHEFPNAVSYERFIALIPRVMPFLALFKSLNRKGKKSGIYFTDSKKLPICHNRRIYHNKVFKNTDQHGKSSTGWFYGFKLFLVINQFGEIL